MQESSHQTLPLEKLLEHCQSVNKLPKATILRGVREPHSPRSSSTNTIPSLLVILLHCNNETLYIKLILFVANMFFKTWNFPIWIFLIFQFDHLHTRQAKNELLTMACHEPFLARKSISYQYRLYWGNITYPSLN